jgi:hypothetical protein
MGAQQGDTAAIPIGVSTPVLKDRSPLSMKYPLSLSFLARFSVSEECILILQGHVVPTGVSRDKYPG